MTRRLTTGIFVGALLASSVLVQAQTTSAPRVGNSQETSKAESPITLVGCVRPGVAPVGTSGTAGTAGTAAGTGTAPAAGGVTGRAGAPAAAGHFVLTEVSTPERAASAPASAPASSASPSSAAPSSSASPAAAKTAATAAAAAADAADGKTASTGGARGMQGDSVILEGAVVAPHLNQRVELTGALVPIDGRGATATGGATPRAQRFNVTSVVRVLGTCGPQ